MEADKVKRISPEQREIMLNFMEKHRCLGTGRFTAPDGAKQKQRLLLTLSETLNCVANGVSKTPDKWLKSWQDWRADVKAKASLLKREMSKTGGGQVKAKPLTPLEERLLAFLGPSIVHGHKGITDPETLASMATEGFVMIDNDTIVLPLDTDETFSCAAGPSTSHAGQSFVSPPIPASYSVNPSPSAPSPQSVLSDESARPSSQCSQGAPSAQQRNKRRRQTADSIEDTADEGSRLVAVMERQADIASAQLEMLQKVADEVVPAMCSMMRAIERYCDSH